MVAVTTRVKGRQLKKGVFHLTTAAWTTSAVLEAAAVLIS